MEAILLEEDPAGDRDVVAIAAGSVAILHRHSGQPEIGRNAAQSGALPPQGQLPSQCQSYH